jgi:hypothetical protein
MASSTWYATMLVGKIEGKEIVIVLEFSIVCKNI